MLSHVLDARPHAFRALLSPHVPDPVSGAPYPCPRMFRMNVLRCLRRCVAQWRFAMALKLQQRLARSLTRHYACSGCSSTRASGFVVHTGFWFCCPHLFRVLLSKCVPGFVVHTCFGFCYPRRLPVYPSYALQPDQWLDSRQGYGSVAAAVQRSMDTEGLARASSWCPGLPTSPSEDRGFRGDPTPTGKGPDAAVVLRGSSAAMADLRGAGTDTAVSQGSAPGPAGASLGPCGSDAQMAAALRGSDGVAPDTAASSGNKRSAPVPCGSEGDVAATQGSYSSTGIISGLGA